MSKVKTAKGHSFVHTPSGTKGIYSNSSTHLVRMSIQTPNSKLVDFIKNFRAIP